MGDMHIQIIAVIIIMVSFLPKFQSFGQEWLRKVTKMAATTIEVPPLFPLKKGEGFNSMVVAAILISFFNLFLQIFLDLAIGKK